MLLLIGIPMLASGALIGVQSWSRRSLHALAGASIGGVVVQWLLAFALYTPDQPNPGWDWLGSLLAMTALGTLLTASSLAAAAATATDENAWWRLFLVGLGVAVGFVSFSVCAGIGEVL